MREISVLIVDDERMILDTVEIMVNRTSGFKVIGKSHNSRKALELFQDLAPDIVISDIQMPNLSGIEFVGKIREISDSANIIFMSGYSDFEYARSAIKYHVKDYLLKPVDEVKLEKLLRDIASDIYKRESVDSKIFDSSETKNAMIDSELLVELKRLVYNIEISDYKKIETRCCLILDELQAKSASEETIKEVLTYLSERLKCDLQYLVETSTSYSLLKEAVLREIKRQLKLDLNLSAKEVVDLLEELIKNRYAEKIDGKEIFRQYGYNEVYLMNLFKKEKGISPKQLQKKVRIERAVEIMHGNPDIYLKTIAEMVGYDDPLYFSKVFKDVIGRSPHSYVESIKAL